MQFACACNKVQLIIAYWRCWAFCSAIIYRFVTSRPALGRAQGFCVCV